MSCIVLCFGLLLPPHMEHGGQKASQFCQYYKVVRTVHGVVLHQHLLQLIKILCYYFWAAGFHPYSSCLISFLKGNGLLPLHKSVRVSRSVVSTCNIRSYPCGREIIVQNTLIIPGLNRGHGEILSTLSNCNFLLTKTYELCCWNSPLWWSYERFCPLW